MEVVNEYVIARKIEFGHYLKEEYVPTGYFYERLPLGHQYEDLHKQTQLKHREILGIIMIAIFCIFSRSSG